MYEFDMHRMKNFFEIAIIYLLPRLETTRGSKWLVDLGRTERDQTNLVIAFLSNIKLEEIK